MLRNSTMFKFKTFIRQMVKLYKFEKHSRLQEKMSSRKDP